MIELYDVNDLNITSNVSFDGVLKTFFVSSVIIMTIIILTSLIVWMIGTKVKSEKAIKFGVKSSIISIVMQIILLIIPILINFANSKF